MPPARPGVLPTFFIPGAPKCGTTTIDLHLRRHPQVVMANPKEPDDFGSRFRDDLTQFAETYPHYAGEPMVGDATVKYMVKPESCERIKRIVPDARFVVCLREPIARAISHYEYRAQRGEELRPFAEVLAAGLRADVLKFSAYAMHLRVYLDTFSHDRFLFIDAADLAATPQAVLTDVFSFLDVAPMPIDDELRANVTRSPGQSAVRRVLASARRTPARKIIPRPAKPLARKMTSRLLTVGATHQAYEPTRAEYERLMELFEPEVDDLGAAIGRDFSHWKAAWKGRLADV